jgi:hypothetical protein
VPGLTDVSRFAGARQLRLSFKARLKPVLTARSGDGVYQRIEADQLHGSGCPSTAGYWPRSDDVPVWDVGRGC